MLKLNSKNYLLLLFTLFLSLFSLNIGKAKAQIGNPKTFQHGIVVAAEQHAAQAGVQILRGGGNAVDAAVATGFALAVTFPGAGNIGGGGFMIVHMNGHDYALDFRERAPLKGSTTMYMRGGELKPKLSREGALSTNVPGTVAGLIKVHKRFGKLPLKQVMQPAIELARKGFPISYSLAHALNRAEDEFSRYEGSSRYFTKGNGQPYHEGDLFVQKDLAKTLERIAQNGRAGFYSGKTADLIVQTQKKYGGIITHKDLKTYKAIWRKPVITTFRGYKLYMMPPPSSGGVVMAQMLTMLKPYNLKNLGYNTAKYVSLVAEVMRRAFADRNYFLGDPDYTNLPIDTLLSKSYLRHRMENFRWGHATPSDSVSHGKIASFSESMNTTNFCVVDNQGNAVAVNFSINGWFGSKIAVEGAGFLLNNDMNDFTLQPGVPNMFGLVQGKVNSIQPGKRPLSSQAPTIVTKNGNVRMVLGGAGGPRIITAVFQIFLNGAVFGMNAQEAVSAPRFHNQWLPEKLYYEPYGIDKVARQKLKKWGYHLQKSHVATSEAVFVDSSGLHGAPDPRRQGYAAGY